MPSLLGKLTKVENSNPEATANDQYYSVWVRYNGRAMPLLLTEYELDSAVDRAQKNRNDVAGDIRPVTLLDQ